MDLEQCGITLFKEEPETEYTEVSHNVTTFSSGSVSQQQSTTSSSDSVGYNSHQNNGNDISSESDPSESSDGDDSDETNIFLFPESVQAIAETVGVELDEEAAELIGQEAINKLRHLTLLALQFSRHCKSKALRVVDVSKAEMILDTSSSLGHGMNVTPPKFISLGGLCSEDEGPEVDLLATVNEPSTNTITIDPNSEPVVQSHFCHYHDHLTQDDETNVEDQEMEVQEQEHGRDDETVVENGDINFLQKSILSEKHLSIEWAEYLKHFLVAFFDKKQYSESNETSSSLTQHQQKQQEEEQDLTEELDDFQILLKDVAQYGVFPILDIICDFFHDYINGNFDYQSENSNQQLKRIPVFIDTMLGCPIRSKKYHLKLMTEVLTSMIILPVPCSVQPYVTRTLLRITDTSETPLNLDLIQWMTQFVVDVLSSSCKLTLNQLTEPIKSKICAAIQFVIGFDVRRLQLVNIHLWIEQVLMISNNHYAIYERPSPSPTDTSTSKDDSSTEHLPYNASDSYLEECILNFIGMYIKRYHNTLPDDNFQPLLQSAMDKYGEKLLIMII